MGKPVAVRQIWDPVYKQLVAEIRPVLEEFVRVNHPECKLGAFVLNIFAAAPNGDVLQETFGDGDGETVTPMEAYSYVVESMQFHLSQWQGTELEVARDGAERGKGTPHGSA